MLLCKYIYWQWDWSFLVFLIFSTVLVSIRRNSNRRNGWSFNWNQRNPLKTLMYVVGSSIQIIYFDFLNVVFYAEIIAKNFHRLNSLQYFCNDLRQFTIRMKKLEEKFFLDMLIIIVVIFLMQSTHNCFIFIKNLRASMWKYFLLSKHGMFWVYGKQLMFKTAVLDRTFSNFKKHFRLFRLWLLKVSSDSKNKWYIYVLSNSTAMKNFFSHIVKIEFFKRSKFVIYFAKINSFVTAHLAPCQTNLILWYWNCCSKLWKEVSVGNDIKNG